MRHLIYGVLAGLLLATPAAAQSGSAAASKTSQDQAAKDNKTQPDKSGQAAPAPQAPPAAPAKDDSLATYDVNGSNASDAMGASR